MRKKILIRRYDPETADESFLQAFNLDLPRNATVLDALIKIKEEHDGSLSFRRSCRSAICGSCAVTVNGVAVLACNTQFKAINWGDSDVSIEALGNLPVVKDLVVNFYPFWHEIEKTMPWLEPKEESLEKENVVSSEEVDEIEESANCIMCGSCFGDCTIRETDDKFMGPAALAKAWRFVGDVRDSMKESVWKCSVRTLSMGSSV